MLPLEASSSSLLLAPKGRERGAQLSPCSRGCAARLGQAGFKGGILARSHPSSHHTGTRQIKLFIYTNSTLKRGTALPTAPRAWANGPHGAQLLPRVLGWCRTAWPLSVPAAFALPAQQEGHAAPRGWRSAQLNPNQQQRQDEPCFHCWSWGFVRSSHSMVSRR